MLNIKTVTVVGANGTMGTNVSAIFASFGESKVYMISRDIEKSKKAALRAGKTVKADSIIQNLVPADYSMLTDCVMESDLVFESAAENLEIKIGLHTLIGQSLKNGAVACTGSSGLSITRLAECYPKEVRSQFFGVHMFNPPYQLTLCELTASPYSDMRMYQDLMRYLTDTLYRTVAESKDLPAFLGNRIGFYFMNEALQYAEKYQDNGGIDYIDALLGPFTGRTMPPITTADFVGLDVHKAIVDNIYENTNDYVHEKFVLPSYVQRLIDQKKLGRKSGEGLYKLIKNDSGDRRMMVYDIKTGQFRDEIKYSFPFALRMKAFLRDGDYDDAIRELISNRSQEADICLRFLLRYIIYSLYTAEHVGYDLRVADDVMATGFTWCPPFAMMEAFTRVCDLGVLMKERLKPEILGNVDIDHIIAEQIKSKYDYRIYFKAK
jgi:3-hydroxyacyl-CoA dehydrogenase